MITFHCYNFDQRKNLFFMCKIFLFLFPEKAELSVPYCSSICIFSYFISYFIFHIFNLMMIWPSGLLPNQQTHSVTEVVYRPRTNGTCDDDQIRYSRSNKEKHGFISHVTIQISQIVLAHTMLKYKMLNYLLSYWYWP